MTVVLRLWLCDVVVVWSWLWYCHLAPDLVVLDVVFDDTCDDVVLWLCFVHVVFLLFSGFPLKVMEAVLQNVPKEDATYEGLSRSDIIHGLEVESGLTELLLR